MCLFTFTRMSNHYTICIQYKLSAIRAEEMHGTSKYDKFLQTFAVPYQQSSTASFTTIGESFDMSATSSKEPPSAYYATYLTLPGPSPHHSERKGPRLSVMPLSTAASSYINSRGEYNTSISSSRSSSSDVVRYLSAQVGYLWAAVRGESPSQRFFNNHEYYSIDRYVRQLDDDDRVLCLHCSNSRELVVVCFF